MTCKLTTASSLERVGVHMSDHEIMARHVELSRIMGNAMGDFEKSVADALEHLNKVRASVSEQSDKLQRQCSRDGRHRKCLIGGCSLCGWSGSPA